MGAIQKDDKIATVAEHYASHLAPIYSWMVGDFDAAVRANELFFDEIKINPTTVGTAVDLGCGHGIQTIALARRGFQITAIDSSQMLLDELESHTARFQVATVQDDLINVCHWVPNPVEVIVCMGDTLTHLVSYDDVRRLILACKELLTPGGGLVFTYRDYSGTPPSGFQRFIPVRSDENRIHVCFLEFGSTNVYVHDILHTRAEEKWTMSVSAYPKLRIAPQFVSATASDCDLLLAHQSVDRGMTRQLFRRPL